MVFLLGLVLDDAFIGVVVLLLSLSLMLLVLLMPSFPAVLDPVYGHVIESVPVLALVPACKDNCS
jgi:hypothetical protein